MTWTAGGDPIPRNYQTNLDVLSFQRPHPAKNLYLDSSPNEPNPIFGHMTPICAGAVALPPIAETGSPARNENIRPPDNQARRPPATLLP